MSEWAHRHSNDLTAPAAEAAAPPELEALSLSRVGQHVAIGIATERSPTTRLKDNTHPGYDQPVPGVPGPSLRSSAGRPAIPRSPGTPNQVTPAHTKHSGWNVDVGSRGKRTAPVGRQSIPSAPPCPRAGWVSISRFEWLRDAVQPSGLRTHGGRRDRAGQRVGDSPCGVYREPASPAEPR